MQNNNLFRKQLFEENSFPFGEDGQNIPIRFFDELNPENNYCVVTNQWMYPRASKNGGKRLDLVFLINGIPMVIGEVKKGSFNKGDKVITGTYSISDGDVVNIDTSEE